MAAKASRITWGLLAIALVGAGLAHARGGRPGGDGGAFQGQEVVTGYYSCSGSVYTDDQDPQVSVYSYLSATSGITDDFYGPGRSSSNVPPDLDAMASICEEHVSTAYSSLPQICATGSVRHERGAFGNGESVSSSFDFSCQGTRDQVIGVIGLISRMPLQAQLP